jgi:toxic protein SymE
MLYEYRRKDQSQARVPWLQLKGHWLDKAGFGIDVPVTVRVMEGCLVLTTEQQQSP